MEPALELTDTVEFVRSPKYHVKDLSIRSTTKLDAPTNEVFWRILMLSESLYPSTRIRAL